MPGRLVGESTARSSAKLDGRCVRMRRVQDDEPALVLGDDDQPVVGRPRPRFQRQRLAQQADVATVRVHHRDPLLGIVCWSSMNATRLPSRENMGSQSHVAPVTSARVWPVTGSPRKMSPPVANGSARSRQVRRAPESMTGAHRRHGKGDQDGEDRRDRQRSPGRRPCRRSSKCEVHGEPPFGRRPPRPLAPMRRDRKDAFEVVGIGAHREVVEHVRQVAFVERTRAHADVLARKWVARRFVRVVDGDPHVAEGAVETGTSRSRHGIRRVAATSGSGSPA